MTNEGLKVMSFNCRSVKNKTFGIMSFLTENNVDIALLQETWLKKCDKSTIAEINEYGFNTISNCRPQREGGWVAILYKANIKVEKVTEHINLLNM